MSIKKAVIILIIIAIIGSIIVVSVVKNKDTTEYSTVIVTWDTIIQTVSETGTVKAADEIDLNFLNSGRIAKIYHSIGDQVKAGDLLAELDYSDLEIKRDELNANVDVTKETLNKYLAGATSDEINVSKAGVAQAKAAYDASQKELDKTVSALAESIAQAKKTLSDLESSSPANITVTEQAVISAEITLNNTKSTYQSSIDNKEATALITIEDKIAKAKTALDTVTRVITDEDGKDLISKKNPIYLSNTKATQIEAQTLVNTAENSLALAQLNNSINNTNQALDDVLSSLTNTFTCLSNTFSALENSVTSSGFTQAELDILKTSVITQQTAIGTAISAVQTTEQSFNDAVLAYETNVSTAENSLAAARVAYNNQLLIARNGLATTETSGEKSIAVAEYKMNTAKEAWQVTQAQYNQIIAPANRYDVELARAKVRQAEASLNSVNKQIENSLIKSPINGTITKINNEVGEQVFLSGAAMISLLGSSNFEIEVLISEADITKISLEDSVLIDLDAFGEDTKFIGKIYFIEPAETIIQDVIYYQVNVSFDPGQALVKSGMTANTIITTAEKENVLAIPSRAIITRNGAGKFARVLSNGQIEEKAITTGLRGDGGVVEVLSGISEGEAVVTYVKNGK